jgi:hypothetical protein
VKEKHAGNKEVAARECKETGMNDEFKPLELSRLL